MLAFDVPQYLVLEGKARFAKLASEFLDGVLGYAGYAGSRPPDIPSTRHRTTAQRFSRANLFISLICLSGQEIAVDEFPKNAVFGNMQVAYFHYRHRIETCQVAISAAGGLKMDKDRFTTTSTGELRRFHNELSNKPDWQFIPVELPIDWEFAARLWPLLVEAKEALGTLNGIGRTLPDPELLIRPQQTREAIQSSKIEGTVVTPQQLLLYELDPREPASAEGRLADWHEVFNYTTALRRGCEMLKSLPICNRIIKDMHRALMFGVRGERNLPGEFRPMQVQIGSSGRYVPPPASEIERLMGNLETYLNLDEYPYDPLVMCFLTHYQFEAIHPFADGNGRVGRCLLALLIYIKLGHHLPWLYLSPYFEQYDDEYASNLFRISTHGDWERWVEFCLNGTIRQAKDSISRCERLNSLLADYYTRLKAPSTRTETIIRQLFKNPIVNIPEVRKICGNISHNTAQRDIDRLVDDGILSLLGSRRPRSYYASEIWAIAYSDLGEASNADADSEEDGPSLS